MENLGKIFEITSEIGKFSAPFDHKFKFNKRTFYYDFFCFLMSQNFI